MRELSVVHVKLNIIIIARTDRLHFCIFGTVPPILLLVPESRPWTAASWLCRERKHSFCKILLFYTFSLITK